MTVKQDSYVVRSYRTVDFTAYSSFLAEVNEVEPGASHVFMTHLREELLRPNHYPQKDLFLVECAGRIVACLDITREIKIGRVILCCRVHPAHRRRGLASRLLTYTRRRSQEAGARVAHVYTREDNHAALTVLDCLGFRPIRRFIHLRINLSDWHMPDMKPNNSQIRHLKAGEEEKLARLQNRSFAGSWGFCPNSTEEIIYRTHLSQCSPEDIILAGDGDLPVAYCWTRHCTYSKTGRTGQILMLGVDPAYRGREWGRKLLIAGLSYLKSKNTSLVELTVDSENRIARELYDSIGFEIFAHGVWHEKEISHP